MWEWVHTGRKGRSIHLQFCKFCVSYILLSSPHPFLLNFFLQFIFGNDVSMHTLAGDTSPKYAMQHRTLAHDAISLTHPYNMALCIACTLHQRYVYSKHLPGCTVATAAVRHQSIRYPTNLLLSCRNMTITYGYF